MAGEQDSSNAKPAANYPKQAVVVIHGIGEQIPMDTIKSFVEAVWESDAEVTRNGLDYPSEVWSKPDFRTGSLELRRITTRPSCSTSTFPNGVRTDFYELYWADLSTGSTLDAIENWIVGLLWRNPYKSVPEKLRGAWVLLWLLSLLIVYLLCAPVIKPTGAILGWHPYGWLGALPSYFEVASGALLAYAANAFLKPYVGRVVRYTRATPDNIAARKDIRERGLALLDALHAAEYERIIVVGHSLGSILGYDLLNYCWAQRLASHTVHQSSQEFSLFRNVETTLANFRVGGRGRDINAFRNAQRALSIALRTRPAPTPGEKGVEPAKDPRWLITDFVTLGSPLTHAEFLLSSNRTTLQQRIDTREFPTAPPVDEIVDQTYREKVKAADLPLLPSEQPRLLSFPFGPDNWQMHHAAVFAATRWTNIFDQTRLLFFGDFVSGPLAPLFGPAVTDVDLKSLRGQAWRFTHTKYWTLDRKAKPGKHIEALRRALNLAGQIEPV